MTYSAARLEEPPSLAQRFDSIITTYESAANMHVDPNTPIEIPGGQPPEVPQQTPDEQPSAPPLEAPPDRPQEIPPSPDVGRFSRS